MLTDRREVRFDEAAVDPALFPVLARAAQDSKPAFSPTVEWLIDSFTDKGMKTEIWVNYTQIFRVGFRSGDDWDEKLRELFAKIELVLIEGVPYRTTSWTGSPVPTTCGGYRHYLGRELNEADILRLRPLREPFGRIWDEGDGGQKCEWITETSLTVIPQFP